MHDNVEKRKLKGIIDCIKRSNDGEEFTADEISVALVRSLCKAVAVVFTMLCLFKTVYTVGEQEQAVLTQFGQVQSVKNAGLYFRIPFIQKVHRVKTTTQGMPIGYSTDDESGKDGYVANGDAMMITSDFNFVNIDFYLEYKVSDPVKYIYNAAEPLVILRNETMAAIRSTVTDYTVDEVITTGKTKIQSDVKDRLIKELGKDDIGIEVVNITIQDSEPPTDEVRSAFKAVENAKQGADTALNNAKAYQSEKIPAAEAEADKIVQSATADKEARISEAEGQVARFNQTYAEYEKYPLITKQRMFYETIESVLPNTKLYIDDGGVNKLLPLENMNTTVLESAAATEQNNNSENTDNK